MGYSKKFLSEKADKLGRLNKKIKALQAEEKELKAFFKASGHNEIQGKIYSIMVSVSSGFRLNTDKIRETMGAAWVAKYSKPFESVKVLIS